MIHRIQAPVRKNRNNKKDYITTGAGLSNLEGIAPTVVI